MFGRKIQTAESAAPPPPPPSPPPPVAMAGVPDTPPPPPAPEREGGVRAEVFKAVRTHVFATINVSAAVLKGRAEVRGAIETIVSDYALRERLKLTSAEQRQVIDELLNDMFGIGPIEPLLEDESVTDILVNGADQIYVERHGRLELTSLKFRDDRHVINVAQRIAASVGRRVDESSPMVDARLADGSRVNVVMPPLSVRGACISIRKFGKRKFTLQRLAQGGPCRRTWPACWKWPRPAGSTW